MSKVNSLFLLLAIILMMGSCSSTKVIASWSLNPPPVEAMEKVLVLGVMANRELKEQIEREMVHELHKVGVNANPATDIFGPKGFRGLTEEQVADKLHGSAYGSVLIVSLQSKETKKDYSTRYSTPYVLGYNLYYRRYLLIYDNVYTPDYYASSTEYILEADIYTLKEDELIYSAQTRSSDPESVKSLADSFSKSIVTELKDKGIIQNKH